MRIQFLKFIENKETQNKNVSGVSTAIQNTMELYSKQEKLINKNNSNNFTIKVANTLEERAEVFRLGYQVYLEKGFIKENDNQWFVQEYDNYPSTLILAVKDKLKKIVGSITLVFKDERSLPAERIYGEEINQLACSGKKILEICRNVISPDYRNSKEILILMFNYLCIYSYHVKNYDSMVIEVNPRHKGYFEKLLKFKEIGGAKLCPSVQYAPATLLVMNLKDDYYADVMRFSEDKSSDKKERSLYSYFLKANQEKLVAHYLEKQAIPISDKEREYFGLTNNISSQVINA